MKVLFCHIVIISFSYEARATSKDKQDVITELNVMKRLKPHPHVLKLIGCCSISGKSGPTVIKTILVCIIIIVMEILFVFLNAQL